MAKTISEVVATALEGALGSPRTTVLGILLLFAVGTRIVNDPSWLMDFDRMSRDMDRVFAILAGFTLVGVNVK